MSARTVYTMLEETASRHPEKQAFHQPVGGGDYQSWTWREVRDLVQCIAVGLNTLDVEKGAMVALQSETRAEFYLADLAIMAAGAVAAALYTSLPFADQGAAIRFFEPRVAFVENTKVLRGLRHALGEAANGIQWILLTNDNAAGEELLTLDKLTELGRKRLEEDPATFDRIRAQFDHSAIAILYMTSGATGEPKMGLVSHRALVTNLDMTPTVLPLTPDDCTVAFLPSAHMAQRMVAQLLPIHTGAAVWFSEGLSKLPHELRRIRPTFFLSPPRVWERMYSSILAEIRKRPLVVQKMFYMALGTGSEVARLHRERKPVPLILRASLKFFDKLMFAKIRARLGGRLKTPISGSAPLSKDLAEFYAAIGMPLREGYGLTEGGVISVNPPDRIKPGSIGTLLPGIEVKIEEDGELLARSTANFDGYYKDPVATTAIFRDGWLATGDIAECDADGYYYITGRKKEVIVSSNGKKIYPARIEGLFKREPTISQVLLIGDKLPFVTALITVNGDPKSSDVAATVEKTVKAINKELPTFEQIRKFRILDREFSIETGELTPTMKLRKSRIIENHRTLVNELYAGRDFD
ncbi:MAG: AMP-binding protein [Bryobacteraceae bacterium]